MTSPQVSVIMPVYNEQKYVSFAVESILNQKFRDFELIVIDDGSKDGTNSILKSFEDPRITLVENDTNLGTPASLNLGIECASGNYIARMDADDICHPHRLSAQFDFLDANPDVLVVGSSMYMIDIKNRIITTNDWEHWPELDVEYILNRGVPCPHASIMMRKHVIKRVGGYREVFKRAQDLDLWLRLAEVFTEDCLHNLPGRYYFYRVDGGQLMNEVGTNARYSVAAKEAARLRLHGQDETQALQKIKHIDSEYFQYQSQNVQQGYHNYSIFRYHMMDKNYLNALSSILQINSNLISIKVFIKLFIRDLKIKFGL